MYLIKLSLISGPIYLSITFSFLNLKIIENEVKE